MDSHDLLDRDVTRGTIQGVLYDVLHIIDFLFALDVATLGAVPR